MNGRTGNERGQTEASRYRETAAARQRTRDQAPVGSGEGIRISGLIRRVRSDRGGSERPQGGGVSRVEPPAAGQIGGHPPEAPELTTFGAFCAAVDRFGAGDDEPLRRLAEPSAWPDTVRARAFDVVKAAVGVRFERAQRRLTRDAGAAGVDPGRLARALIVYRRDVRAILWICERAAVEPHGAALASLAQQTVGRVADILPCQTADLPRVEVQLLWRRIVGCPKASL